MYSPRFDYHRAESIDHALRLLSSLGSDVKLLAGGHSLVPALKLRLASPTHLIDISACSELMGVREEDGRVHIGAATTYRELEIDPLLAARVPLVPVVAGQVADMLVRNRGTIGGSLCNSDPNADFPVCVLALDARLHVRSLGSERVIAVSDWFDGLMSTALRPDEILEAISVASRVSRCAAATSRSSTPPRASASPVPRPTG